MQKCYHVFMSLWNPADEEILICTRETDNPHDSYTVSIMHILYVNGHVLLGLSKPLLNFLLLPGSIMLCVVIGKKAKWCGWV